MPPAAAYDFVVARDDLRRCDFAPAPEPADVELGAEEVLLGVDRFGFTANNVTYAVFGDAMRYWDFFPAREGWGRVPVWGFADVLRSEHEAIAEGERIFGYLPVSTTLVVQPGRVTPSLFLDASPHRAELPGAYQQYSRVAGDPGYAVEDEDHQALLRPLYMTSFLCHDFLRANELFGAERVVFASASSKTALGVAFLLAREGEARPEVVGLTSPGNVGFCERVGYYDTVVSYEELDSLDSEPATVFVDMAGDGRLLHAVHTRLAGALVHSCIVGATHWEERETQHELPGAHPEFFFAPTWIEKRRQDWGGGGIEQRYAEAWQAFLPSVREWMEVVHGTGPTDIERIYREVLDGATDPSIANVLAL